MGITRAQKTLALTLASTRKQFGEKQGTTSSRFIEELPKEDIEREGFGEATAEQIEKKGEETLSSLKGLFG